MKPWMGLAKLSEESAELIQVAAKLAACPEGTYYDGKDLIKWLQDEMADVSAILQFVEHHNNLAVDHNRVQEKYRKFCEWFGVQDDWTDSPENMILDKDLDERLSDITSLRPRESLRQWMDRMVQNSCDQFTLMHISDSGGVELIDTPKRDVLEMSNVFLLAAASYASNRTGPVSFEVRAYNPSELLSVKCFVLQGGRSAKTDPL